MTNDRVLLPVVAVPGLVPDSLGGYLASLGLLRVLARQWPSVRAAWRSSVFHVVGGPSGVDGIVDYLVVVATRREWTPYERGWSAAQKESTAAKTTLPFALWQARAEERALELIAAHVVPVSRLSFNPLLGTGGNAGKRAFSDGWKRAVDALAGSQPTKKRKHGKGEAADRERPGQELRALLSGRPLTWELEKLNAASWFSDANKLYNSGQHPFREGTISPWAMVLACEGLPFLAGGASRRLGARARGLAAFPFVTVAAAPCVAGEAGRDLAEVWAPVWDRPMTVREMVVLFTRGRAEVRGRGVLTPSAFATAALRRGVDGGIVGFRRFVLGRTTSANSFEPRYMGPVPVRVAAAAGSAGATPSLVKSVERVLALVDRLPRDKKVGKRWRFEGLRGPIEAAMVKLAARPDQGDAITDMLDAVVAALDRVDRNRAWRERGIVWRPLDLGLLTAIFGERAPGVETRLAIAVVSGFPRERPFALYRFGVEQTPGAAFVHRREAPARWVWRQGALSSVLSDVVRRRTLDWEDERDDVPPARTGLPAPASYVGRWLGGQLDEGLLAVWLSRLSLFDWRAPTAGVKAVTMPARDPRDDAGAVLLFGLLQPLFDLRPVFHRGASDADDLLPIASGARRPAVARRLASLVRSGDVASAVRVARSRYGMASCPLVESTIPWAVANGERLLASVLFPISHFERSALVERWLRPRRQQGDAAHG